MSMKNSSDTIGNRACDLPACSAVMYAKGKEKIWGGGQVPSSETHHSTVHVCEKWSYFDSNTATRLNCLRIIQINEHLQLYNKVLSKRVLHKHIWKYRTCIFGSVSCHEEGHLGTLGTGKRYKHHAMKIFGRKEYWNESRQLHAPADLPPGTHWLAISPAWGKIWFRSHPGP
jgi:hypothetical protein